MSVNCLLVSVVVVDSTDIHSLTPQLLTHPFERRLIYHFLPHSIIISYQHTLPIFQEIKLITVNGKTMMSEEPYEVSQLQLQHTTTHYNTPQHLRIIQNLL